MRQNSNYDDEVNRTSLTLTLIYALLFSAIAGTQLINVTSAQANSTVISIKADGSVEGTDKIQRDGNVYTLIADLSGAIDTMGIFIAIEKDGIIFDGDHKTIQGTGSGIAISVVGRKDVTIKNTKIINFGNGIELQALDWNMNTTAANNKILDNYIDTKYFSIDLNTDHGTVSGNTLVSRNSKYGVLFDSNNTVFSNNQFVDSGLIAYEPCLGNVFSGNTINGKTLVYLEGESNQIIDGAAQVFLTDCSNMIVRNVYTSAHLRVTITLFETSNSKVTSCRGNVVLRDSHSNTIIDNELRATGSMVSSEDSAIGLTASHNNTIAYNSIAATAGYGVSLTASSYNKIQGNDISSTGQAAVKIDTVQVASSPEQFVIPTYNYVFENNITCTESGVSLRTARNTFVFKNSISGCKDAIMLSGSHENHFLGNHIIDSSQYGINLAVANDNTFYHNNFLDNAIQAYENHRVYWWWLQNDTYYSEGNTFDNGEEGNYWSDYTGVDEDGDGIGETPHPVYENFTDRYPLTTPFDVNSVTIVPETWSPLPSPEPTPTPIQSATPEPTHSPDPTPTANSFPIIPVAIVSAASAAIVGLGLLVCLKKSRKPKNV